MQFSAELASLLAFLDEDDARKAGLGLMETTLKRDMTISNEHGLHLRAAAMIARTAKDFDASIQVCHGSKTVNGKSTVGLMTLGTPRFGSITVEAEGADAVSALDAIEALLHDDAFIHQSVA